MNIAQTSLESLTIAIDQLPWLAAIWFCFLGGCIGSFMNVVVYRIPAGMSLMHPGSCCPNCQHAIRARDNLPVLGWLLLKGRCRDCQVPISRRYPIVEGIVAAAFLIFWWADVWQLQNRIASVDVRLSLFAIHALLFSTIFCVALMDLDGHPVTAALFLPCLIGFVCSNWASPITTRLLQDDQMWVNPLLGGAFGGLVGLLVEPQLTTRFQRTNRLCVAALVGITMSATAVAVIALVASLSNVLFPLVASKARSIWLLAFAVAMVVWVAKLSDIVQYVLPERVTQLTCLGGVLAIYACGYGIDYARRRLLR
ncbi:MAG: prepilin peptidase [Pirellulaceae bacterium]|nr:prepilin peptidase [Pirellulaceae bacterium]